MLDGESEWILTFGSRTPKWTPGKHTLQLSTPTKSTNSKFEIFDP
jgi:hypothetical protein